MDIDVAERRFHVTDDIRHLGRVAVIRTNDCAIRTERLLRSRNTTSDCRQSGERVVNIRRVLDTQVTEAMPRSAV